MLKVEWISLIGEKLRQIFNSDIPFAGIPILMAGELRHIVPVNGKPLFSISKYFNLQEKDLSVNDYGISTLSGREEKGFRLYMSSKFATPLTTSVSLSCEEFADLKMKIAIYEVTSADVDKINKFYCWMSALQKSPWIDFPWLFPTWKEVNEHLRLVTERAKTNKGIFRA